MRLTISQKIITPNVCLMLLALGTMFFGHYSFQKQQEDIFNNISRLEKVDSLLTSIDDGNDELVRVLSLYGNLQSDTHLEELTFWEEAIDSHLTKLQTWVATEKEHYLFERIVAQQQMLSQARQALMMVYRSGDNSDIQTKTLRWSNNTERKTAVLQDYLQHNDQMLAQSIDESLQANQRINRLLMWTLILVLLAMSASVIYYRLLIVNPLQALKEQAEEFASGNFDQAHDEEFLAGDQVMAGDEIDELRLTLKKMALQLDATTVSRDKLFVEIEARKTIEKQLAKAQKMEAVGQLTGGIAHDFNNILGIARGNLELLGLSNSLNEKNKQRVAKIEHAITRAADLTDRLLRFSKNQNSDTQLVFINRLLDNLKLLVSRSFTVSINVIFELEETLWPVELSAAEFEDAMLNLALNAKDAMPEGGDLTFRTQNIPIAQVPEEVAVKIPGKNVVKVSVVDSGTGMSELVLNRITEPFFSTKSDSQGSGLGLSMVYGFVSRSGGDMQVNSTPGVGSSFSLFFPASERKPETAIPATKTTPSAMQATNRTILIVDDEPELLEVTAMRLKRLGYNTLTASDGLEAMSTLLSGMKVELLLTDIVMPGELNGLQLAKKAHQRFPDLAVVLSSGYSQQLEQKENVEDPYIANLLQNKLAKPYTHEQLQRAIEYALKL